MGTLRSSRLRYPAVARSFRWCLEKNSARVCVHAQCGVTSRCARPRTPWCEPPRTACSQPTPVVEAIRLFIFQFYFLLPLYTYIVCVCSLSFLFAIIVVSSSCLFVCLFVCVCACVPLVVLLCLPVQLQMSPLHLDEKCVAAASRARVPGECTLSKRS